MDDRPLLFPIGNAGFIRKLCDRTEGIGADGVVLLRNDSYADFQMRVFNSDGSEAESCGNGLRCLVHFITELSQGRNCLRIRTGGRVVEAGFDDRGRVVVNMGAPQAMAINLDVYPNNLEGCLGMQIGKVHFVDTGVPHAVQFVTGLSQVDVLRQGRFLRSHPFFAPRGVNVNFVSLEPLGINVRTFERGVEGETLSCGTGAVAVGAIARRLLGRSMPIQLRFRGGVLEVSERQGAFSLVGPVQKLMEYTQEGVPSQTRLACGIST